MASDLGTNFDLNVYLKKSQTVQHVSTTQNCTITSTSVENHFHSRPDSATNYVELRNTETIEEDGMQSVDYDLVDTYEDYNIGFINPADGSYIAEFHGVSHTQSQKNTVVGACIKRLNVSRPLISISLPPQREEHIYIFR